MAKIARSVEATILQKVKGRVLAEFESEDNEYMYVHRICRYFIKALDFIPFFCDAEGNEGRSEDYKPFSFPSEQRDAILCFIDSTLFYWFCASTAMAFTAAMAMSIGHHGSVTCHCLPGSNSLAWRSASCKL